MYHLHWEKVRPSEISLIPHQPGVYLFAVSCDDGKAYVCYSGQSVDLGRRIAEHFTPSEPNAELRSAITKCRVYITVFYAVTDQWILDGAERFLFDIYEPQFTDRAPDVRRIAVTVPLTLFKGKVNFQ